MIKRAVIGYLIQWSPHSSYDILFRCNYAAPTAPHVFIASSTHVKLKSSLCTWYSIIARRNRRAQWENVKAADLPCLPRRSALCHHRALVHAQGTPTGIWILNRNWNVSRLGCVESTPSPCSFFYTSQHVYVWTSITKDKMSMWKKKPHDCADSSDLFFYTKSEVLFNTWKFNWRERETLGRLKFSNF